jgi:hypothetical protein
MEQALTEQKQTTVDTPTAQPATTQVVPITMALANRMREKLEKLAVNREAWEQTAYARSNEMLYGLLCECYVVYKELTCKTETAKNQRRGLDDYIAIKGYSFKQDTPLTAKIIRCVFAGTDRRRLSTYHTVLRVAVKNSWKTEGFSAEIMKLGGVQEISLGGRKDGLTPKKKAEVATPHVLTQTLAIASSPELSKHAKPDNIGAKAVALLTQEADGRYTVHAVVYAAGVVNEALAAYYSTHEKEIKVANGQAATTAATETRNEMIDAAAQAVVNG